MLKFDQSLLMQIAATLEMPRISKITLGPLSLHRLDSSVLDALFRLLLLLDEPKLIPQLSPLIQREILVRLLHGPHGAHLWNLLHSTGPTRKIAQAVNWIRQHFADEMRVEELAEKTHMSPTTFRQHFRSITGMNPVQFQKVLRLQEARQIMLDQNMSAGGASAIVGYESASQFQSGVQTTLWVTAADRHQTGDVLNKSLDM
jgi:AraC-like DNA-binding protein